MPPLRRAKNDLRDVVPGWIAEDVSRETLQRLKEFEHLLHKWSKKVNLISRAARTEIWSRHIWDSAQLWMRFPSADDYWDIGSGGGFPAIVCAILEKQTNAPRKIHLVDSDQRKSAFLRAVKMALELNVVIHNVRVQEADTFNAQVITARALADIDQLITITTPHLRPDGCLLLLKGKTWESELQNAKRSWNFKVKSYDSYTQPGAAVLEISDITPR